MALRTLRVSQFNLKRHLFSLGSSLLLLQQPSNQTSMDDATQTADLNSHVQVQSPSVDSVEESRAFVLPSREELLERLRKHSETQSESVTKALFHERALRLEAVKGEIYTCLYSIEWKQELWDVIAMHELPHKAFLAARKLLGEEFTSAFEMHAHLVMRNARGNLCLTPDARAAWTHIHAELVAQS